jgi:delta-lactam-biosynthetic de-N-acetylase
MKKHLGECITAVTLATVLLTTGCSSQDAQEETTDTNGQTTLVKNDTSQKAVSAVPGESKTEQETKTSGEKVVYHKALQLTENEIAALPNDRNDNYFGGDRNEENVPMPCLQFQEKYGQYNADFVRTTADNEKVIYLTFDEGYENGCTEQILDVLKEKNVTAVFFCTMPYLKDQPELVKRMIADGHIVGNHSETHPSDGMISLSLDAQKQEIADMNDYVAQEFDGYEMQLFRYPAGIYSEQSLALMGSLGYTSVFWSFAYADWDPNNQPDETEALQKCLNGLHPGAIYLLHAVSKTNTEILGSFIDEARAEGYTFEAYY